MAAKEKDMELDMDMEMESDDMAAAEEIKDTLEISGSLNKKSSYKTRKELEMPEELKKPRKLFVEEILKTIVGVILVLLFIALFIGIVWYFLIQLDATLFDELMGEATEVSTDAGSVINYFKNLI
ncbi:MAG: hypothetical protein IKL70_07065 [Oscillospiraceae bacterium]|nr:hypothetical protein [Oscillospiraceae bacterium]MBR6696153.1 hypothetical protein [Oscillospiraceae bacterium]